MELFRTRFPIIGKVGAAAVLLTLAAQAEAVVDLRASLRPSAIKPLEAGAVPIAGTATDGAAIRVRITTSFGDAFETQTAASNGQFACRFPQDFVGAPALVPQLLYVDATDAANFGGTNVVAHQAEVVLIVAGAGRAAWPDLPLVFMDDFVDAAGRKDREAVQWSRQRALANLFMRSRGAALMRIGRADFDLATPADFAWFKEHATLYDFDHRDRDWSKPLGNRVARGFWQAVWNTWFNASNDHPWDGNPTNRAQSNYRPYTFANDAADLLVLYRLRPPRTASCNSALQTPSASPAGGGTSSASPPTANAVSSSTAASCNSSLQNGDVDDNRVALADEVTANLLAMQHRSPENFALKEASGRQQHYTAGAFRYGMFESGEWLTEGTGWFANPSFRDFDHGGVLNGRCIWALGETLKAHPDGPHAAAIRSAIPLTLRFCLHDGLAHGYTRHTKSGRPYWGYPGEHGYLLMGMLAAAEVAPDLPVKLADDEPARPLREVCVSALDALAETVQADGSWSPYPNADAVNIIALSEGALLFPRHEHAKHWTATAVRAADLWMSLKPLAAERTAPTPHFGMRRDDGTTFYLGATDPHPHISLYVAGHWIHGLARLHQVTNDPRYRERAEALLAYYCGDNPLHMRLLNELGAINNRVTDSDNDGIEDQVGWDGYPESTAFVQIGLLHLLRR